METIIIKIIESSIVAGILIIVLWVFFTKFLPDLIASIKDVNKSFVQSADRSTKEHAALTLMILNVERRMNWHEAKVYGVNPSVGSTQDEQQKAATEAFIRAEGAYTRLNHDIHELFGIPNNHRG